MAAIRRYAGLIAALLLIAFGLGFVLGGSSRALGLALVLIGGVAAALQVRALAAEPKPDPYDLSRLWERDSDGEEAEEADEDAIDDDGTLYCHSCGHAVPRAYGSCPDCRRPL